MRFGTLHLAEGREVKVGLVDARLFEGIAPWATIAMIRFDTSR
jgi:hypothetical protein